MRLSQINPSGQFSLLFSRPVEIEIGYLNVQLLETDQAEYNRSISQSDSQDTLSEA